MNEFAWQQNILARKEVTTILWPHTKVQDVNTSGTSCLTNLEIYWTRPLPNKKERMRQSVSWEVFKTYAIFARINPKSAHVWFISNNIASVYLFWYYFCMFIMLRSMNMLCSFITTNANGIKDKCYIPIVLEESSIIWTIARVR